MSLKEVAKMAGVSPSTVSRVVNSGDVSAASLNTRQRIWDAVREVGYVPNLNARTLRQQPQTEPRLCSRDIDCVYARIAGPHIDPFFTTLMHAVEVEAFSRDYTLRYQHSIVDLKTGKFQRHNADVSAAIVLGRADEEAIKLLKGKYKHLVCAGLQTLDCGVDEVVSSGYQAAASCVSYLNSLGHTRICYLGETENEQRYHGYVDAMQRLGITELQPYVVEAPFTHAGAYDALNQRLEADKAFTAILCANDMLAVGALKALKVHKIRVPEDVSVIGINDMDTVRYLDPMLTTVHIPLEEMGKHVAKILIDRIEGGHRLPVRIMVPNSLVIRESCCPVRPGR